MEKYFECLEYIEDLKDIDVEEAIINQEYVDLTVIHNQTNETMTLYFNLLKDKDLIKMVDEAVQLLNFNQKYA